MAAVSWAPGTQEPGNLEARRQTRPPYRETPGGPQTFKTFSTLRRQAVQAQNRRRQRRRGYAPRVPSGFTPRLGERGEGLPGSHGRDQGHLHTVTTTFPAARPDSR
jgi:hypothetical protein